MYFDRLCTTECYSTVLVFSCNLFVVFYCTFLEKSSYLATFIFLSKNHIVTNSLFYPQLQNPMVIHVYHPYRQPDGVNHCAAVNGHCSHLCLPAPRIGSHSPRVSCACPNGLRLLPDNQMCVEDSEYICFCLPTRFQNKLKLINFHIQIETDKPCQRISDGLLTSLYDLSYFNWRGTTTHNCDTTVKIIKHVRKKFATDPNSGKFLEGIWEAFFGIFEELWNKSVLVTLFFGVWPILFKNLFILLYNNLMAPFWRCSKRDWKNVKTKIYHFKRGVSNSVS